MKNKIDRKNNNEYNKLGFKGILRTAFVTILAMIGGIGFVLVSMSAVCPQVVSKAFDFCGFDDANYLVYKRIYAREKTNENLYNVIQLSINRKEYADMEEYIKIMLDGDNFAKFAKAIDKETKKVLGESFSIYADSYESYLRGELTLALYKNGNVLEAKMRALDSLFVDAQEMYVYANCIADDQNLIDAQKQSEFNSLKSRYGVEDQLKSLLEELNDENLATDNYAKISVLEQKIKLSEIRIIIASYDANVENSGAIKEQIKAWNEEIISLSQE
jgi:hypothetical protein